MTLVFTVGDFWIETFEIPSQVIANGVAVGLRVTFERAGRFVGGSSTVNESASVIGLSSGFRQTDGTKALYGESITQLDCIIGNNSGAPTTMGGSFVVLMKK